MSGNDIFIETIRIGRMQLASYIGCGAGFTLAFQSSEGASAAQESQVHRFDRLFGFV
jgi:hypothetical protein